MDLDEERTYVIAHDEYMITAPRIYEFRGTLRRLAEHLNQITDENRADEFGDENMVAADFSTLSLLELFKKVNGDGQPFYQVWDPVDHKQLI